MAAYPASCNGGSVKVKPLASLLLGEEMPLPEVIEKNSDSAWALWSDTVASDQSNPGENAGK